MSSKIDVHRNPMCPLAVKLAVLLALWPACSSDGGQPDEPDAASNSDGSAGDLDAETRETYVTGTLDGNGFVLTYAAVDWGSVDAVCISNVPVAAPDCGFDGQPKLLIYGWFAVDGDGGVWGFPQVELRDIGANVVELATDGWLTVHVYDEPAGRFEATFELTFPSGLSQGTVVVP